VSGVNLKAFRAAVRIGHLPGMFGVRSQHLARPGDEVVKNIEDLYIDIGDAQQVAITTPVTFAPQFLHLGDSLYCSPYMDNRGGCAVVLQLARRIPGNPVGTIYLIGTVQEETTCAGALRALQAITPDAAIFVDRTVSYDTPDTGRRDSRQGPRCSSFLYTSGQWLARPSRLHNHLPDCL
jgi:putative aminopeptidase FrvX